MLTTTPRGGVAAPTYQHPSGDPIASYSASAPRKPWPPTTPRYVRSQRENLDAHRTALQSNLEQGWSGDNHVPSIFSTYRREKALLLADALASAGSGAPGSSSLTPRTALVPDGVGFTIGDGATGCLTAEARAGAKLVALPGRNPRQVQGLGHSTPTSQRSPSPRNSPRHDETVSGVAATEQPQGPNPLLFQFVSQGDSYFVITPHHERPSDNAATTTTMTTTTNNSNDKGASQSPPPPQLVWTVTAVPKETKAAEGNDKQAPPPDPDLESKPAETKNDHPAEPSPSQDNKDKPKAPVDEQKPAEAAPADGAQLRIQHLTIDATSKSLVHGAEHGFDGAEFVLQTHETVTGCWALQHQGEYLGIVPLDDESKGSHRHVVALVSSSKQAWRFTRASGDTYHLEHHDSKAKLAVVRGGAEHTDSSIVTVVATAEEGTAVAFAMRFAGGKATTAEPSSGGAKPSPKAASAKDERKPKKKKKAPGPQYDFTITLEEQKAAPVPAEQQWGLHQQTAAAADGSRLYFFTSRAFPQYHLVVDVATGAATLRRRPRGDQGIQGAVLVRSRHEVIVTSEHSPPKPAPKPVVAPPPIASSMRIGDRLEAGKYLQSPNGEHRLTLLASGNLVLEPIATVRARVKYTAAQLKKGPVTQPQPPAQRGGPSAVRSKHAAPATPSSSTRSARRDEKNASTNSASDPPPPPSPTWQTGTSSIGTTLLTFNKPGVLSLVVVGGDPHAGPLWQLPAYGRELRVTDEGVLEVLATPHQVTQYQRLQRSTSDTDDYSDDDTAHEDDVDPSDLVIAFTSVQQKNQEEQREPTPDAKPHKSEPVKAEPTPTTTQQKDSVKKDSNGHATTASEVPTQGLRTTDRLTSQHNGHVAAALKDGSEGLVVMRGETVLWSSRLPLAHDPADRPSRAVVKDGDLVVERDDGRVLWRAGAANGVKAMLSPDADALVVVDAHGHTVWSSATHVEPEREHSEPAHANDASSPPRKSDDTKDASPRHDHTQADETKPATTSTSSDEHKASHNEAAVVRTEDEKRVTPSHDAAGPSEQPDATPTSTTAAPPEEKKHHDEAPTQQPIKREARTLESLAIGEQLHPDDRVKSADGAHVLVYQSDGNVVLYDVKANSALWATNTDGKPTTHLVLQGDRNVVLYDGSHGHWASNTQHLPGVKLVVRDAAVHIVDAHNDTVWSSNGKGVRCRASLSANEQLKHGDSLVSADGEQYLKHQGDGNVVLYETASGKGLWATNTSGKATTHFLLASDFGDFELGLFHDADAVWQAACGSSEDLNAVVVVRDASVKVMVGDHVLWSSAAK